MFHYPVNGNQPLFETCLTPAVVVHAFLSDGDLSSSWLVLAEPCDYGLKTILHPANVGVDCLQGFLSESRSSSSVWMESEECFNLEEISQNHTILDAVILRE